MLWFALTWRSDTSFSAWEGKGFLFSKFLVGQLTCGNNTEQYVKVVSSHWVSNGRRLILLTAWPWQLSLIECTDHYISISKWLSEMKVCEFFPKGVTCHPSVCAYNAILFLKTSAQAQLFQMLGTMSWLRLSCCDEQTHSRPLIHSPPNMWCCAS